MNDIFKDMQAKVGCEYISDLPSYKRKVWQEMKRLNPADYEERQLEDFSKYVFGIQFNVSHSGEFVFMGFAYEKRIGVDIEKINLSFQYQCISDKFLSKKEIEDINKSKNIEKFYNLWTAKEAYVKAIGIGLFKEFKSFSVSEDIIKENNKIEEGWFLKNIKLNEEYVACVVLQK